MQEEPGSEDVLDLQNPSSISLNSTTGTGTFDKQDIKYKKYASTLEKILTGFDVEDWHDIIPFLGKIYKTIVQHPQFPNVPKKAEIFKRLAQALNPNLPSGVHQKALDVYTVIFERIGPLKLLKNISVYSFALFSFFEYATMSVKPVIINIYERFYLPLGKKLRICLKDVILGILPALEEEGNEFFDKTIQLLDRLQESVGSDYFYSAIWYCIILNTRHRLAAFHYLARKCANYQGDMNVFLGRNREMTLKALSLSLEDRKQLVVRHALDFICSHFPLESSPFSDAEVISLMGGVLSTLMKREMSLTRRVYNWIIPVDTSSGMMSPKVKSLFKNCIKNMLDIVDSAEDVQECTKTFKIIISLQDKTEIGQVIINELMMDVVQSLQKKFRSKCSFFAEVMQYANMFIEMIDSFYLWKWIYCSLKDFSERDDETSLQSLNQLMFVLENFKIYDDDVIRYHIPFICLMILQKLTDSRTFVSIQNFYHQLRIFQILVEKIPDRIYGSLNTELVSPLSPKTSERRGYEPGSDILKFVDKFYEDEEALESGSFHSKPVRGEFLIEEFMLRLQALIELYFSRFVFDSGSKDDTLSNNDFVKKRNSAFTILTSVYNKYLIFINARKERDIPLSPMDSVEFSHSFIRWSQTFQLPPSSIYFEEHHASSKKIEEDWLYYLTKACFLPEDFNVIQSSISFLVSLRKSHPLFRIDQVRKIPSFSKIIRKLWNLLQSKNSMIHLRVCILLWDLYSVSLPEDMESIISSFLSVDVASEREEHFKRFSTFWTISDSIPCPSTALTQPLFLMTDAVLDSNPHIRRVAETWIRCCVRNYVRIIDPFVILLLSNLMKSNIQKRNVFGDVLEYSIFERHFNYSQVHFALSSLLALCRFGGKSFFSSLKEEYVQTQSIQHAIKSHAINLDSKGDITYANLLLQILYQYSINDIVDPYGSGSFESALSLSSNYVEMIHNESVELLIIFVMQESFLSFNDMLGIRDGILEKLLLTIQSNELEYQLRLLMLLQSLIALTNKPELQTKASISHIARRSLSERLRINAMGKKKTSLEALSFPSEINGKGFPDFKRIGNNPLFFKTIMCAFSTESNMILSDHWIDFSLSIVPHIMDPYRRLIIPLINCLLESIDNTVREIKDSFELQLSLSDIDGTAIVKMMDFSVCMSAIHRIFMFCLTQHNIYLESIHAGGDSSSRNSGALTQYRKTVSSFGLRIIPDFVRDVMQQDYSSDSNILEPVCEEVFTLLTCVIEKFDSIWLLYDQFSDKFHSQLVVDHISQQIINIRNYIHTSLLEMYDISPVIVVESLLEFSVEREMVPNHATDIFYVILKSSVDFAINLLLDLVRVKASLPLDNQVSLLFKDGKCSDTVVLGWLMSIVTNFLMPHQIIELWPSISVLVKDYLINSWQYKYSFVQLSKLVHSVVLSLHSVSSVQDEYEDREKVMKDIMDTYIKLVDYCCLIASRNFEQGIFSSRKLLSSDGQAFDAEGISISQVHNLESSASGSRQAVIKNEKLKEDLLVLEAFSFMVKSVCPTLKKTFVLDSDRLNIVLQSLNSNIINVYLKHFGSSTSLYQSKIYSSVTIILFHLSVIPASVKIWKKDVWDYFMEARFFLPIKESDIESWKRIIQVIISQEPGKINDILNKISFSNTTNLFANRDFEDQMRSSFMKRLSFVLLIGEEDQYVKYLPELEAKMMEFYKTSRFSYQGDFFSVLCAIFTSFKKESLHRFFPISFSILFKLLKKLTKNLEDIKADELKVYLAAFKFIDLFLHLPYDETQSMRWLFISDPESIFAGNTLSSPYYSQVSDQLSIQEKGIISRIRDHWVSSLNIKVNYDPEAYTFRSDKLLLRTLVTINDISELAPFIFSIENVVFRSALDRNLDVNSIGKIRSSLLNDFVSSSSNRPPGSFNSPRASYSNPQ